ncbi:MAG: RluA family pseudouridine synthase [Fimbriiglobus sp.]
MRYAELLDILWEDNHLLALNKPCGWPSAHFDGETQTMDLVAKEYLREKYQKPGNVFLGVVHRLDRPVSGCLLFARTSKAASRISEQFRESAVEKVYWAITETPPAGFADSGTMEDWLLHDEPERKVHVVEPETHGSKQARLRYVVRAKYGARALIELHPQTGRKHQLRVQLASRGVSILGDAKYGNPHRMTVGIALHARQLSVIHPTTTNPVELRAEVPKHWRGPFAHLLSEVS